MANMQKAGIAVFFAILIIGVVSLISTRPDYFTQTHVLILMIIVIVLVVFFLYNAVFKNS